MVDDGLDLSPVVVEVLQGIELLGQCHATGLGAAHVGAGALAGFETSLGVLFLGGVSFFLGRGRG